MVRRQFQDKEGTNIRVFNSTDTNKIRAGSLHQTPPKSAPEIRAISGAVIRRSPPFSMVREAITPEIPQPVPISTSAVIFRVGNFKGSRRPTLPRKQLLRYRKAPAPHCFRTDRYTTDFIAVLLYVTGCYCQRAKKCSFSTVGIFYKSNFN